MDDLINKINTNASSTVATIEERDPYTLLGKINEVIVNLESIRNTVGDSDAKANLAVENALNALHSANDALAQVGTAVESSNTAVANSNEAIENANKAVKDAMDALAYAANAITNSETAIANSEQAIATANDALAQVVGATGTSVKDVNGNVLATAEFTGHNGINVDMGEVNPNEFNIRLDETITTAIEDIHTATETNKAAIAELTSKLPQPMTNLVGDYNIDINDLTSTQNYYIVRTNFHGNNLPTQTFLYASLYVNRSDADSSGSMHATQIWVSYNVNSTVADVYYRDAYLNNDGTAASWEEWKKVGGGKLYQHNIDVYYISDTTSYGSIFLKFNIINSDSERMTFNKINDYLANYKPDGRNYGDYPVNGYWRSRDNKCYPVYAISHNLEPEYDYISTVAIVDNTIKRYSLYSSGTFIDQTIEL